MLLSILAVLDLLVPAPISAEARNGVAPATALERVVAVEGAVPGAPAETADEAYVLEVKPDGVRIVAPSRRGEIWARVTLEQLVKLSGGKVPCCRITDWPKFRWRGFMHDSGRNFLEVKHVKALIDAMQRSKMNLFHWHITEYYGWRLESKVFPELQSEGAFFKRDIGRYYTQDEFREIVDYAWKRGVTVMPEFDVPGHAYAFRRAFGFKTMRDEGVREKLCALIDELCSLVPAEKMPFVHLGSDEARCPEEIVKPGWMEPLVDRVHAAGRTVVGWTPGELKGLTQKGPTIGMRWGNPKEKEDVGVIPCFDAYGMYLDTLDPFELLGVATYRRICPWDESLGSRYGAITCAWHDDYAGGGVRTIENQCVIPALVLFGDSFWRGRDDMPAEESGRILPRAGNPRLKPAQELERRMIAQRDRVWNDFPYPFQFVGQTQMRWRALDGSGKVVAKDIAQGTVFFWQAASQGVEGVEPAADGKNLLTNKTGVAVAETWIRSPVDQEVGAWIGFTDYVRDHGRAFSDPTPNLGQWSRFDATVELNGERVPPPVWRKPGQVKGEMTKPFGVYELDEVAFENEEYYMREPTRIRLRKGWNHVKLTVPMKTRARGHNPWVATFMPILGTTWRPREVPGLEYSSEPQVVEGENRPFLAVNEDNDRYIISASGDPALLTEQGARDYFDSVAAGGAVTHFFMCVNGQRASYDSKVWEPIWLGVNDRTENGDTNNAWCVNAKILNDRGVDIWKVWCARAREKGVSPWISMRMNDAHYVHFDYKVHRNESFWWEHPEWWRSPHTREERFEKTGRPRELDFSHPEVFDHAMKLVEEILERWDADGIELDWMRQPWCLTAGKEAEQAYVLTDFMRRARKLADAAAKRRGHPVGVCVRVPSLLAGARLMGYDIETWVKEGLMDIIVPTSAYSAAEYDFGVADWRRALGGAAHPVKLVFGTDCCIYNHAVERFDVYADNFSFFRGWAANAADGDGYYIFNAPYYREPARSALYSGALAPELVAHGSRRYPITYHEWTPNKAMADNQMLRRSIGEGGEFHLNVRKYPHDRSFVLIFGVDRKDDPPLTLTLNGVSPAEPPRAVNPKCVVPNPAGFVTNPLGLGRAWAWKFPPDVIRDGRNSVVIAPTKTEARAVWCEIMVK